MQQRFHGPGQFRREQCPAQVGVHHDSGGVDHPPQLVGRRAGYRRLDLGKYIGLGGQGNALARAAHPFAMAFDHGHHPLPHGLAMGQAQGFQVAVRLGHGGQGAQSVLQSGSGGFHRVVFAVLFSRC